MPLNSDINRDNKATVNPYDPPSHNINAYTAIEIATLQARLNRQLGPEYISTRPGAGGGKLHYLSADKVINLANSIFGFNGWSSSIQQVQIDFVDENASTGKISLGLSIICRITLKDGTYHEDIGYGNIENCKGKAAAFDKAKKEAATDAMKRALRSFGNVLGNCLYDKDYLAKVSKMKVVPTKFNPDNLHRHPDFAPVEQGAGGATSIEAPRAMTRLRSDRSVRTNGSTIYGEDEFEDDALFDSVPPDAVLLEDSAMLDNDTSYVEGAKQQYQTPARPLQRVQSMPNVPNQHGGARRTDMQPPQARSGLPEPQRPAQQPARVNDHAAIGQGQAGQGARTNGAVVPIANGAAKTDVEALGNVPGGRFVSMSALAKGAVEDFDPSKETPSSKRTTGVSGGKSEPVLRAAITGEGQSKPAATGGPPAQLQPAAPVSRPNFVNPAADAHRRIGMPVAPQSPMSNRGAYKPPSAVKRPAPSEMAPGRPPLADTTNVLPENGPPDSKRPKLEPPLAPGQGENVART